MPQGFNAKRVLLVDDDPLVLRLYSDALSRQGFQIATAENGLAAIKALRTEKPDFVVLDLMMPKFTGVDVLKFIRSQPDLARLPVVVLSNSYMDQIAAEAASLGVEKALLKIRCTPAVLKDLIDEILAGKPAERDTSELLAAPKQEPPVPRPPLSPPSPPPAAAPKPSVIQGPAEAPTLPSPAQAGGTEFQSKVRREFFDSAAAHTATLRNLAQTFSRAANDAERSHALEALGRKVHFITAAAGMAGFHYIALMASALEALVFEAIEKPTFMGPSVIRTVAFSVDFLARLFEHAREFAGTPIKAMALVVDDDPLSNRVVGAGLRRAQVGVVSTEDPMAALQLLEKRKFDLVLLDIEMPGLNGFELCKRLRAMPGYQKTPVIFVSGHGDFEHRAKSILSGGDDLISKPVFSIELAVKAITHLLGRQLKPPGKRA